MGTIGLWNIAEQDPEEIAVVDPAETPVTYRELATAANQYAHGFRELGLRTGDSVVLLLPNGVELLTAYFAAYQIGLYVVPVNWHLAAPEVSYIIQDSEAKAFIAHERFRDTAVRAVEERGAEAPECFAVGEIPEFAPVSELASASASGRPTNRTAGSPMLYTSGTTGKPKGVRRPLTGADPDVVQQSGLTFFGLFGIQPRDGHVHLCGSPLYHTAVLNFTTLAVQLGHTAVVMDGWNAERMLRLIEQYSVTHTHMVPTQFHRLLMLPDDVRAGYDVASLRAVVHGAAPCPVETKRRMLQWWGPVMFEYYAATEGGGTVIGAEESLSKPGSVGRAWPYSRLCVIDDQGRELEAGEIGTVYMSMGASSFEYHGDSAKTEDSWLSGMFTVGDIGYLDSDGYLYLCDRRNDVIISGGVNIYPAEIENALAVHPDVADAAVFGVPNEDWGEEVKAVIEPRNAERDDSVLADRLLAFLQDRVARFKLPRTVDFTAELPRDPNGKLSRRALRDPFWQR